MKIKDMNKDSRPRERLLKFGIESLSDAEILALILEKGTKQENVIEMSNRLISKYGILQKELDYIVKRDNNCVYCHKNWVSKNKGDSASIEHLNHKSDWDSVKSFVSEGKPVYPIIAICCGSCNSSRGSKSLRNWFKTPYCIKNNINYSTVSPVVKEYIDKYEKEGSTGLRDSKV